ncbi:MAG: hypothetical protein ABI723_12750 [Bacteroidia bacterium]
MHWKKFKNKDHHGFKLFDDNDKVILKMELPNKKSPFKATLECDNEVYKIKRKGFWKSEIFIVDDKDKLIAEVNNEKQHYGMGSIKMANHKYYYTYRNNPLVELIIYLQPEEPLISYKLITKSKSPSVSLQIGDSFKGTRHKKLLIGLGWYMFQPIARENQIIHSE